MAIENGFYSVQFAAAGNPGEGGVISLENGRVLGGDSQYLYAGTVVEDAGGIQAELAITARTDQSQSVFGTVGNSFQIRLSGSAIGNGFTVSGTSTARPGATINIQATFIAPLGG